MSEPIGAAIIKFVTAGAVKNAPAIISNIVGATALQVGANLLTPKAKFGNVKERDSLNIRGINSRGATDSRSYIYGQVRVGGTVVYMETTGTDNEFLHMVLVHCDHEVEELGDVYVNDVKVNFDSASEGSLRNAQGTRYRNSLYIADHLGGPSQTVDSTLDAASGKWYSSDKLSGMAYTYIRMELKTGEDNAFPNGIPTFTRVVKGRKVYDPRLDSTQTGIGGSGSHRADDSTTWEWSDNWALCVADYITSDFGYGRFGNGWSNINIQELADSADNCDDTVNQRFTNWSASEEVTFGTQRLFTGTGYSSVLRAESDGTTGTTEPSGPFTSGQTGITDGTTSWAVVYLSPTGTESRYTINGVIEADEDPLEVVKEMKGAAAGFIEYIGGSWVITSGRYQAPTITLTESDFAGPIAGTSKDDRTRSINGVRGVIANKDDAYNVIDVPPISSAAYVTEDNGVESFRDLKLLYTTSTSTAQRLFKIELNRARQSLAFRSTFTASAFRLKAGDTFSLDFDRYGWSGKVFQVWSSQLKVGGDGELVVDMEFRETASTLYDYTASSDETVVDPAPNTSLPDPFDISNATGLTTTSSSATMIQTADGTIQPTIHVSWTAAASVNVTGYELRWERFVGQYEYMTLLGREVTSAVIYGVVEDSDYEVQIRSLTPVKTSAWSSVSTVTAIGKSAAPTAPTGFTATAIVEGVKLSMDEHPDVDFKQFLIYQNITNSKPGSHSYTTTDTTKTITGLTAGTEYFFWLEAEDTTAHTTAAASNVNATPTATAAGDVTGLGALATEDTVDLTTTGNGGVSGVLPTTNTDATDNGTTIDTSGNVNAAIDFTDSGAIKHGKTSSDDASNSGFWLGEDGQATPDYDFHIGDSSNSLKWDGSTSKLTIKGDLTAGTVNVNDNFKVSSAGAVTVGDDSAGKNYFLFQDTIDNEAAKLGVYDSSGDNVGYLQAVNDWAEFKLFTGSYSTAGHVNIDSQGLVHIKTNGAVDDAFAVERPIGSTSERFNIGITKTGVLEFGLGGTRDCNLYRDSSGVLKTDDSLIVGANLTLDGRLYDGQSTPSSGTSGQVLSSTGTGVEWIDSAAGLWTESGSDIYYTSGNVGIGETNIDAKLHLTTTGAGLINQKFESAGSAAWRIGIPASQTYFAFDNANDNLSSPKVVIDSSGRLGIGETSPVTDLHIKNSSATQLCLESGTSSTGYLLFGDSDDLNIGSVSYNHSDNSMRFETNDSEQMRIDANGDTTFAGDVYVDGGKVVIDDASNPYLRLQVGGVNRALLETSGTSTRLNSQSGELLLRSNNTTALTLDSSQDATFAGNLEAKSLGVYGNNTESVRIMFPGGASMEGPGSNTTGAIKITLPNSWTDTMMQFTVKVYEYVNDRSFEVHVAGYDYNASATWVSTSATIVGGDGDEDINHTVRFAHDGSKCTVFIGELADTWQYPVVSVCDFQGGYNNPTMAEWDDGWDVSMETTSFGTVTKTHTNTQANNWKRNGAGLDLGSNITSLTLGGADYVYGPGSKQIFRFHSSFLYLNAGSDFSNGVWLGTSDIGGQGELHLGSNGTPSTARLRMVGGSYNGTNYVTIDANGGDTFFNGGGNFGIGTTSPSFSDVTYGGAVPKFHVYNAGASGSFRPIARFQAGTDANDTGAAIAINHENDRGLLIEGGRGTGNQGIAHFGIIDNTGAVGRFMTAKQGGNVGIGTTSPDELLHVENSSGNAVIKAESQDGGTSAIQLYESGNYGYQLQYDGSDDKLHLWSKGFGGNDGKRVTFLKDGRVGIGTASPSVPLQVDATGEDGILLRNDSSNNLTPLIEVRGRRSDTNNSQACGGGLGLTRWAPNNQIVDGNSVGSIYFGGAHGATTADEANILYTASIKAEADETWSSASDMATDLVFRTGSTGRAYAYNQNYGDSEVMRITHEGRVGIKTTTPSAALDVIGEFELSSHATLGSNLYVDRPSDAWTSSTTWINVSDYGVLNTGGSYALTLNGNGYRSNNGDWESFNQNSLTGATQIWQYPAGYITFNANSSWATGSSTVVSERMRIFGDGNVSIGTTSSGYKLRVEGTGYFGDRLTLGDVGSEGGELVILDQNNAGTQKLTVDVDSVGHSRIFQAGNGNLQLGNLTGGTGETRLYCNADAKVRVKSTQTEITDQLYVSGYSGSDSIVTINGIDCGGGMLVQGSLDVDVNLDVSGSKNFRIAHPVREGYDLRHTCVESPQADLTYRGTATLVDGAVQVDLDSEFGMTAGTFAALNDEVQVFVQNESGWDAVRGSVNDGVLTIDCQNTNSTDSVGWLVIGRRIGIELEIEPKTKIK